MEEEWKPIKGYEDYYQISNFGKIKSIPRKICTNQYNTERILKPSYGKNLYLGIILYVNGKSKRISIARTVLEHFGPPKPISTEKLQVNHIDGNKQNNLISNLEWVTSHGNHIHAVKTQPLTRGAQRYNAVFTNKQVIKLRKMYNSGKYKWRELAKECNVSNSAMFNVITKRTYKYAEEEVQNGGIS